MDLQPAYDFFCIVYGLVGIPGVLGNFVVMLVICVNKSMHTATSFFLFSMSLSDVIFLLFCIPLNIYVVHTKHWLLGDVLCSLFWYLMYVTVLVTCITMGLLAADRFLVFCHPMTALQYRQPKVALLANLSVWIFSLVACLPFMIATWINPSDKTHICREGWGAKANLVAYSFFFVLAYVLPVGTALVCYGNVFKLLNSTDDQSQQALTENVGNRELLMRRRKRVTFMVSIITLCFIIIWTPIHTINFIIRVRMLDENHKFSTAELLGSLLCRLLFFLGSTVNPIIYAFVGRNFRNNLTNTITRFRRLISSSNKQPATATNGAKSSREVGQLDDARVCRNSNGGDGLRANRGRVVETTGTQGVTASSLRRTSENLTGNAGHSVSRASKNGQSVPLASEI
ncbi:G-protein coupled receptor 54-like [Symsagittifera roscoffensis]|uniref:G-protein coupled receptor 54-like n=1 Tax=Symsagittifera roscoffensis TaxID=84072 RepID=UPI00307B2AE0